jgi:hypothetical protein
MAFILLSALVFLKKSIKVKWEKELLFAPLAAFIFMQESLFLSYNRFPEKFAFP